MAPNKPLETNKIETNKIGIALSTYNGSLYLAMQLEALIAQSYQNWKCYIRDDGSKDDTVAIIQKFAALDDRIVFQDDHKGNLGLNASHYYLLGLVQENYIATCDQDDVWHANKLEVNLKKLQAIETAAKLPALVHSDSIMVDSQLALISPTFIGKRGLKKGFDGIIFANSVQGGSIMLNKSLLDIAIKTPPTLPYDYHLAIIVSLIGERAFIPEALLKYRQHSASSIAQSDLKSSQQNEANPPSAISPSLIMSLSNYYHLKQDFNHLNVTPKAKEALVDYFALFESTSRLKKLWILFQHRYPFYRRKDLLQLVQLIIKNTHLLSLIEA